MRNQSITDDKESIHLNLARLKKGGENFEVAIDPDMAVKYLEDEEDVDIHDVLQSEHIFHDVQKAEQASETRMEALFDTKDPIKVATIILKEGEVQLNAAYRAKVREEKKEKIIAIIAREAIDPRTKLPHPIERVRLALDEAKVRINELQSAQKQLDAIIKTLQPILPLSFERKKIQVTVPSTVAAKLMSVARQYGKFLEESWEDDGSWQFVVQVSGAQAEKLKEEFSSISKGGCRFDEIQ